MKKLIILKGCSGSGKTTLANKICSEATKEGFVCEICSTDSFSVIDGVYKFDAKLLGVNHRLNQLKAKTAIDNGIDIVIIDNTNLSLRGIEPYAKMGIEADYMVYIMEPVTHWARNVDILTEKNIHNVPRSSIEKMVAKQEETDDILEQLADRLNCDYDLINNTLYKEIV